MVLVDARGLPVAIDTASASPDESQLVRRLFDFMLTEENPERMIGDKAYDSDQLAAELAEEGIELIAPHRKNRKPANVTQDGRPLRRYKRRWTAERTIAWIQHFHRLCIRWEKSTTLFQGFLYLGCTMLLLKEAVEWVLVKGQSGVVHVADPTSFVRAGHYEADWHCLCDGQESPPPARVRRPGGNGDGVPGMVRTANPTG